jgi:uncharacterized protein YcaQ
MRMAASPVDLVRSAWSNGVVASVKFSASAARRIALAAQGFGGPRPVGEVTARQVGRVVDTMGILQLDSVNVVSRSHYLPVYSRIGGYPRAVLDRLTAHTAGRIDRRYVEYWAHEASLIPLATHPLLRWRMAGASEDAWGGMQRIAREHPDLVAAVRRLVDESGPVRSGQNGLQPAVRKPGEMWNWHEGKVALEYLFWAGEIGASRRVNFERHYDLLERILPPDIHQAATLPRADAQRELIRIAAKAYGIATEPDLGDYFRLPRADSKLRVAELVEAGELVPVQVQGWQAPAYFWPTARRPRSVSARALISPFDPLIWFRPRALRLFDFHYRIEIYTPAARRVHGYYVLPFLLGDTLVGRVDLKADRGAGTLLVQSAWAEPGVDIPEVAQALAAELTEFAVWLGLDRVRVAPKGDLSGPVARQLQRQQLS